MIFLAALLTFSQIDTVGSMYESRQYIEREYRADRAASEYIGTVYFHPHSHKLSPEGRRRVADIALRIGNLYRSDDFAIKIVGFADRAGDSHSNLRLGLLRAEAVADGLAAMGVPMKDAVIASYGESRSTDTSVRYRKAEVILQPVQMFGFSFNYVIVVLFLILAILVVLFFVLRAGSQRRRRPPVI